MENIAIITNDLQYDLVGKNDFRINAVNLFRDKFVYFLEHMRNMGHYIVHLQLTNLLNDPNAEWYGDYLPVQKGTRGAEILEEFLKSSDLIVEKTKDSGFFDTDLNKILKELKVGTVIITGMQTQICVQTTAADAFFRGYNVWVPSDGVVSAFSEDRDRALSWLDSYCATVSDIQTILSLLENGKSLERKKIKTP